MPCQGRRSRESAPSTILARIDCPNSERPVLLVVPGVWGLGGLVCHYGAEGKAVLSNAPLITGVGGAPFAFSRVVFTIVRIGVHVDQNRCSASAERTIVDRFLDPFVPKGGAVVEIGPGGGRWTEVLNARASHVYVLDVADAPLRVCRERFSQEPTISYVRGDGRTIPLRSGSIDALWPYDVFVHANPADARSYMEESGRVLRGGAYAVIHHPGRGSTSERAQHHRSDLTDHMVREFAAANGFEVVLQTNELVNDGDFLTVLRKTGQTRIDA